MNNGYNDPDYWDLEFREENPEVYGNDEYMQDMRGSSQSADSRRGHTKRTKGKRYDGQFSKEYIEWKKNHRDRVEFFRSPSTKPVSDGASRPTEDDYSFKMTVAVVLVCFAVLALFLSC